MLVEPMYDEQNAPKAKEEKMSIQNCVTASERRVQFDTSNFSFLMKETETEP